MFILEFLYLLIICNLFKIEYYYSTLIQYFANSLGKKSSRFSISVFSISSYKII
ncbi:hypothetical protein HOG21_03910 [bacterium]|nr:hypothetical protein [bacterium]